MILAQVFDSPVAIVVSQWISSTFDDLPKVYIVRMGIVEGESLGESKLRSRDRPRQRWCMFVVRGRKSKRFTTNGT